MKKICVFRPKKKVLDSQALLHLSKKVPQGPAYVLFSVVSFFRQNYVILDFTRLFENHF